VSTNVPTEVVDIDEDGLGVIGTAESEGDDDDSTDSTDEVLAPVPANTPVPERLRSRGRTLRMNPRANKKFVGDEWGNYQSGSMGKQKSLS
jgi:hypothetical protein